MIESTHHGIQAMTGEDNSFTLDSQCRSFKEAWTKTCDNPLGKKKTQHKPWITDESMQKGKEREKKRKKKGEKKGEKNGEKKRELLINC